MKRRQFLHLGATALAGAAWAGGTSQKTSPRLPPLRIAFFTDVHAREDMNVPTRLTAAAKAISAIQADLVIGTGDTVHGGFTSRPEKMSARFELARNFIKAIGRPVVLLPGNHDFVGVRPEDGRLPEPDPLRMFRETFTEEIPPRSWEFQGYRFFQIQTVQPVKEKWLYEGRVTDEELSWLEAQLAGTPHDQPLILLSHMPLQTTHQQVQVAPLAPLKPNLVVTNARDVLKLFANHNLRVILQGHLHVNERVQWNDQNFLMGGAICGAWWKGPNLGTPPGFGVLKIQGSEIRWEYQPLSI